MSKFDVRVVRCSPPVLIAASFGIVYEAIQFVGYRNGYGVGVSLHAAYHHTFAFMNP